jgi:hypothetical protein
MRGSSIPWLGAVSTVHGVVFEILCLGPAARPGER